VDFFIFKSIINDVRHGNYICKSEVIYLEEEHDPENASERITMNSCDRSLPVLPVGIQCS
jgi:hypothetical protein